MYSILVYNTVNNKIVSPHPNFPIELHYSNLSKPCYYSMRINHFIKPKCLYHVIHIFSYKSGYWQHAWVVFLHFRHGL